MNPNHLKLRSGWLPLRINREEVVGALVAGFLVMGFVAVLGLAIIPMGVVDQLYSNSGNFEFSEWQPCPESINKEVDHAAECRTATVDYILFSYDVRQTRSHFDDGFKKYRGRMLAPHIKWLPFLTCYFAFATFVASVYERRRRRQEHEDDKES